MTAERRTVAVIGLGLIGGSIARDLAGSGARVLGYDASAEALDAACGEGVVHARLDEALAGLEEANVIVVATPVSVTPAVLRDVSVRAPHAPLVMDVGSTKRAAVAAAEAVGLAERFVGAHPMAGSHRAGWQASRRGLFAGAQVFLTPTPATAENALAGARAFWAALGARVREIGAAEHDDLVAHSSHAPHMASVALALALPASVTAEAVGPGGRDALRLAAGSPDLWTDIGMENADALVRALTSVGEQLDRVRDALARRDAAGLRALLDTARVAAAKRL